MPERGPLEQELYELLRMKGLSAPEVLSAGVGTREALSTDESIRLAFRMLLDHMEVILRLAKEIDQLRAELGNR